ncbi:MAG TPA: RsmD family RNA methyltransferase, partial [Ferruginibacter sp.]|nr:RsmD family RNA methyltransferase [Ferruginibacter sp.]
RLLMVPGEGTRPITDRAKSALFSILSDWIEGTRVLDLFGGTGAISYELASRGATDITTIEKDEKMYDFIKRTAAELGFTNMRVVKSDVFRFIDSTTDQYDFIFAGPPYALTTIDDLPRKIVEKRLLKPGGWFVLEHTPRNDYKKFEQYKTERNYGTTIFSIFING